MSNRNDLVTVVTNENTNVHFPHWSGTYATLCGLDGDDTSEFSTQSVMPTPAKAKVTCPECIAIWHQCHSFSRDIINWSMFRPDDM